MDKVLNVFQTVGGVLRRHPKKSAMIILFVGSILFGWNLSPEKQAEVLEMFSIAAEITSEVETPVVPVAPAK